MQLLKFGAIWCPGCLVMKPRMEELLKEFPEVDSPYYDYDENLEVAKKWNVKKLPTFIFVDKNGNELDRLIGEIKESDMYEHIEKYKEL